MKFITVIAVFVAAALAAPMERKLLSSDVVANLTVYTEEGNVFGYADGEKKAEIEDACSGASDKAACAALAEF